MKGKKFSNKVNINAGTSNRQSVDQSKRVNRGTKKRSNTSKSTNSRPSIGDDSTSSTCNSNKKYGNDASWYTANPQLLKDATALSFYVPMGSQIPGVPRMPGIMALKYVPSFGVSTSAGSPINIAARNIYSYIRHANSGHANYESPDLMMYLLAMDSAYAYHAWMCRLYGVTSLFAQTNKYLPEGLIKAMGVNYDDLLNRLSDLRYYINQYAVKLGSLVVPTAWSYYQRHIWMCSNLYMDEDSIKPQIYFYNPEGFFIFQERVSETGSSLTYSAMPANMTVDQIIAAGNNLINHLVNSEDINIMSGDILKAYGSETMKVGSIPSEYTVLPVYNEEVLQQMHNVRLVGDLNSRELKVTQMDGIIKSAPEIASSNYWARLKEDALLDMFSNDPSPEDIMVATRGIVAVEPSASPAGSNVLGAVGTEIFTHMELTVYEEGNFQSIKVDVIEASKIGTDGTGFKPSDVYNLSMIATFSKAPFVYVQYTNSQIDPFGNFENYTSIPYKTLYNMHETALLSMFDVPQMGRNK